MGFFDLFKSTPRWQKITAATVVFAIGTYLAITSTIEGADWMRLSIGTLAIFTGGNVAEHFAKREKK